MSSLRATVTDASMNLEKLKEELRMKDKELMEIRASTNAEIEELKRRYKEQIEEKSKCIEEIGLDMSKKSMTIDILEKDILELRSIVVNKDDEIKHLLEKNSGDERRVRRIMRMRWSSYYNSTIALNAIVLTVVVVVWFFRITICSYVVRTN